MRDKLWETRLSEAAAEYLCSLPKDKRDSIQVVIEDAAAGNEQATNELQTIADQALEEVTYQCCEALLDVTMPGGMAGLLSSVVKENYRSCSQHLLTNHLINNGLVPFQD